MSNFAKIKIINVIFSCFLLSSCTKEQTDTEAQTILSVSQNQEATILLDSATFGSWPTGLDPATNATGGLNISLMNAIFGGLFQLSADEDGSNPRIIGVLAESYDITDAGETLIVNLREGVKFSDGTPLNAEAVRFNIERNLNAPCSCAPVRWPWVDQAPVTVLDDRTVALHFSRPYPAAINGFPVMNINWIVSPSALVKMGEEEFKIKPVGAGPFKVVSNQLSSRLELERNPEYWQEGKPYLDHLIFQSIGSEQAAYLALLAGNADAIEGMTSPDLITQAISNENVVVTQQPSTASSLVQLNTAIPPFDNKRAREAIYYATNANAIRKGLFDNRNPASESFTGPGGLFHREDIPDYRHFNLEKARAIVEEIGGLNIELGTLQSVVNESIATALQTQWQQAGIKVSMNLLNIGDLIGQLQSREWQALVQAAGSYDPEAASGVHLRFSSGQLFSGVNDEQLDQLLYDAAASIDMQERESLYFEAAARISDEAYAPFLFGLSPAQISVKGIQGPGLTTPIPPISINTAILWQDVRFVPE